IEPAIGQARFVDLKRAVRNAVKIKMGLFSQLNPLAFHFTIETNEEVIDIQIVFQENLIDDIRKAARSQWIERNFDARHICSHELQDFRSHVEMAKNQVICIRTDKPA